MFSNDEMTAQLSSLFEEGRRYWKLQKQYLSLNATEVLSRLLASVTLVLILILVGSLVLLFGSFALAFWLGELLGSSLLGFGIIALVLLLLAVLVYANRTGWIYLPTTRFMVSLLASSLVAPSQEAIAIEKSHLRKELDENEREMKETASHLLAPLPQAQSRWEQATTLFQNGLTVYRGIQLGASAIAAARSVFRIRRKRK